ncbi:MAG: hypothetical protein ACJATA_001035, partial [Sphingobacteriales bacterium]
NPTHQYGTDGTFEVCLTANNSNGSDTLCKEIIVIISSIKGNSEKVNIVIYPNPTTSRVTIKTPINVNIEKVEIYDYSGKRIHLLNGSFQNEILMDELTTGIYILDIQTSHGRVLKKLIKN